MADNQCPRCGGETTFGYGLAFGEDCAGYSLCLDCDWFDKKGSTLNEPGKIICLDQVDKSDG